MEKKMKFWAIVWFLSSWVLIGCAHNESGTVKILPNGGITYSTCDNGVLSSSGVEAASVAYATMKDADSREFMMKALALQQSAPPKAEEKKRFTGVIINNDPLGRTAYVEHPEMCSRVPVAAGTCQFIVTSVIPSTAYLYDKPTGGCLLYQTSWYKEAKEYNGIPIQYGIRIHKLK